MLPLLIDENVPGDVTAGLCRRQPGLDLVRVQDVGLMGIPDPAILAWAAQEGRVVVSLDKKTLTVDAFDRVGQGLPMPGVIILLPRCTLGQALDEVETLAMAGNPGDLEGRVVYVPG